MRFLASRDAPFLLFFQKVRNNLSLSVTDLNVATTHFVQKTENRLEIH